MYLNKTAGEIQIYTMPHVQPVLAHPELLPPYINSWLNTNIDTQTVISGAGAVRQLGRLLLMQNISKVQTILESKIKKATSGFDTNVSHVCVYPGGHQRRYRKRYFPGYALPGESRFRDQRQQACAECGHPVHAGCKRGKIRGGQC